MHCFRTGCASFILVAIINWKTDLGKLLSWVSSWYLFRLRVPVFNKIVFSSLCILCQCPGNFIASDDFAVKFPSLETHCYISPEHRHWPGYWYQDFRSTPSFLLSIKKGGIFFSPSRKFVSWSPLFSNSFCRKSRAAQCYLPYPFWSTVSAPFTLSSPTADSVSEAHLLIRASQTTPWDFLLFFHTFPFSFPKLIPTDHCKGALQIPWSTAQTFFSA